MTDVMLNVHQRAANDLRAAADLIRTDGWVIGVQETPDGRHCAFGAIFAAGHECADIAVTSLARYMRADPQRFSLDVELAGYAMRDDGDIDLITTWNDVFAGSRDQVAEVLADAATWIEGRPVDA